MIINEALIDKTATCIGKLREQGLKVAFAESCTGGLLAYIFSSIPGASQVLDSSVVVYSNDAKAHFLGIPAEYINRFGAVSEEVAARMAEGIMRERPVDIAISLTGIAGNKQDGYSKDNEEGVGTVFVGKAKKQSKTIVQTLKLGDIPRHKVQQKAVEAALDLIIT